MMKLRNWKISNLFVSFLGISLLLHVTSASILDTHLVNCGSDAEASVENRIFMADSDFGTHSFHRSSRSSFSLKDDNPSPDSSPIYHTARVFTDMFSYEFPIVSKGYHFVRLHFSPFYSQSYDLSSAVFSVSAVGFLLLKDFSVLTDTHLVKEFIIRIDAEKLDLSFVPSCKSSSLAFVNAIEVFSAPRDLILDVARGLDSEKMEIIHTPKQGFETVFRLNIGGPKVTPFNDTLWRVWTPDESYLESLPSAQAISFSGPIYYQTGGASRKIAPDSVYNSARVMNSANSSLPSSNLTWILPVTLGYKYLVRMHFCDIVSSVVNDLYFNIYINGYLAYKDFDLSDVHITNQMLASPYYIDFVVEPKSSGVIVVSLGASRLSSPSESNAILNGLEVMKMNNSLGSFDGEFSAQAIWGGSIKGNLSVWVCSVLGGFVFTSILAIGFVMASRGRGVESKDSLAWSPLPLDADDNSSFGSSPLSRKLVYY